MKKPRLLLAGLAFALLLADANAQNPAITAQPGSLSLNSGQAGTFKVAATNALTYQWRKNGANLALSERVSGVTSPILTISPAVAGDAGIYTVLVSNASGGTPSDPATLAMNLTLPVFTLNPLSQTCDAGTDVGFAAVVAGSEPITYRWVHFGTPMADDGRISGAASTNLTITALTSADSGWYWLTASNADGTVACTPARLTVTTPSELGAAANYLEGTWTSGGGSPWLVQNLVTHDGVNALRSSPITHSGATYIETTVFGPGEVSFYWAVDSEAGYDFLICQLDGVDQYKIAEHGPNWKQQTLAVGWGPHVVRWVYSKDTSVTYGTDAGFLDQVTFTLTPLVSLESAAASMPLPLRTYGDAAWFGQTPINHDGQSAARCGYITHNQSTTLETTVCGPGAIAFNWKVSSETADPQIFLVDGVALDQIAGEVDWTNRTFRIPWGLHTLSWRFQKDVNDRLGARGNAAWLDEVTFTPVTLSGLGDAAAGLSPWTAGGTLPFFGQNEFTADGTAALQSGPITHSQSSSARCGVTGPGTLTFRWKVSCDDDDFLRFAIDGIEQAAITTEVDWTAKTYMIRPGSHVFDWSYTKDTSLNVGYDTGWVDMVAFVASPPLPVAVNFPFTNWTTSGNGSWFPEMVTTHDGAASGRSSNIGNDQATTMETTVIGPGSVTFWWKVSSEYADPLIFLVDGVEQARISGENDWANPTFTLSNGTHTLGWRYQKDVSKAVGADAGWVDQVTFTGTMTYQSWATASFSPQELADPTSSGANENPARDGISNLLKYAYNLDPHTACHGDSRVLTPGTGMAGLPYITRTANGLLRVEYLQRVGTIGLGYTVQFGTALTNEPPAGWVAATAPPIVTATGDPNWARVVVVDNPPLGATRRFARVVVSE